MRSQVHIVQTPSQLAPLLRALRRQRGMTQQDLASALGISRQAVTALEQRPEAATFERLMKVWAVLGLEVALQDKGSAGTDTDW